MGLYEGAKTRVIVHSGLSEESEVKIGMHQGSALSHCLFAVMIQVVIKFAREGALSELQYADDLVLIIKTIDGFRNKLLKSKDSFESKVFEAKIGKTT